MTEQAMMTWNAESHADCRGHTQTAKINVKSTNHDAAGTVSSTGARNLQEV
jgi:hypothetical protein